VPAYIMPSKAFAPAATPTRGSAQQAGSSNVLIRGLPKSLCTSLCLEAMFEQAGLEGTIVNCRMRRGAASSEVLLALSSRQAARRCIQHFHGRCWSPNGETVTAVFAKVSGKTGGMKSSVLDKPLRMPQKIPLPEDAEAEAAEAATMTPTSTVSPLPEVEAPPGLSFPEKIATVEAHYSENVAARKEERSPSLATDESTADGASVASEQEEAELAREPMMIPTVGFA